MRRTPVPLAAALLLLALTGGTLAGDPPRLIELRSIYEREKGIFRAKALAKHIAQLTELQQALTREDHLADAQVVAAKIHQCSRELAKLRAASQPSIGLKAADARLVGKLRLSNRYIRNWHDSSCVATWTVRDIRPGKYHVHLDYIPVLGGGGTVEVRDLSSRATVRIQGATPQNRSSRSTKIGTINVGRGLTLRVAPRSSSRAGVFLLTGVRLTPAAK